MVQTLLSIAIVIFEANKSWSGELVETKGGAQSVGGSSRRKHRPSQGDEDFDEDNDRRDDDDDRRQVNDDYFGPEAQMSDNYSVNHHLWKFSFCNV